jgi:hypothetical protein
MFVFNEKTDEKNRKGRTGMTQNGCRVRNVE